MDYSYLLASHSDNTLSLHLVRSTDAALTLSPARRLHGHTSAVGSVQVTPRGKAVSISSRGDEVRIWELEGGKGRGERSVRVEQAWYDKRLPENMAMKPVAVASEALLAGFDEERVVFVKTVTTFTGETMTTTRWANRGRGDTGEMAGSGGRISTDDGEAGNGHWGGRAADAVGVDSGIGGGSGTGAGSLGVSSTATTTTTSTRTALMVYDFTR